MYAYACVSSLVPLIHGFHWVALQSAPEGVTRVVLVRREQIPQRDEGLGRKTSPSSLGHKPVTSLLIPPSTVQRTLNM